MMTFLIIYAVVITLAGGVLSLYVPFLKEELKFERKCCEEILSYFSNAEDTVRELKQKLNSGTLVVPYEKKSQG